MANEGLKEQLDLIKLQNAAIKEQTRIIEDLDKIKNKTYQQQLDYDEAVKNLRELQDELEATTKEIEKNKKAISDYNSALDETASTVENLVPGIGKVTSAFKKNEEGVIDITKAADSFIAGMFSMMKTIEETNVALAKQTGFATALQQDVLDLANSHDGLYLSMSESKEVVGSLSTGFKMYNAQSKQTRGEINTLAGRFKVLGVDTNTFAAVLDQLNEGFGLTGAGALAAAAELENLAIRTGSPLSSVVNDFQDLGPQMSRFGSDGVRVFTRLNEQARTLGLTTRQAFDLSELFDTFESSADVAGKLNAQLGLQLNSVELMAASSEDRLKILRAEFDMEGMRFDQMSRRQRQMVADILQTDALTAEKLLGDPMAMRKFQKEQENNAERVQKFTTAMDKFKAVAEQLFINLAPVMTSILSVFNSIAEVLNTVMSSGLGMIISKMMMFGAIIVKVAGYMKGFFAPLGYGLKIISMALGTVLSVFLLIKDIAQSFGILTDSKGQTDAQARLAGGLGGAAIGGAAGSVILGVGAVPGAALGYAVGREVPSAIAGDLNGRPGAVRSVTSMNGQTYNISPEDGIKVSPRVGGLENDNEMSQKIDDLTKAITKLAKRPIQATMEINKKKLGEVVLDEGLPSGLSGRFA
jgi:hypothetical protein